MPIKQVLELDTRQYKKRLKEAQRELERYAKQSTKHGKAIGDGVADGASRAERSWAASGRRIAGTLDGVKRVMIAAFSARLLTDFGQAVVRVNSEMDGLRLRFTAITGSASEANVQLAQLERYAMDRGLSFPALAKGVQTMTSFGLSMDTVMKNLDAISTAAILSPNGMEQAFNAIGRALGQISSNGRVAAEEMNQLAEAGVNAWPYLAQALGKTVAEVRKLSESGEIAGDVGVKAIVEGIRRDYPTLLAEYGKTAEAASNRFKEVFRKGLTTVSGDVWKKLGADMQSLSVNASGAFSGGFGRTLKEIGRALGDVYDALKSLLQVVLPLTPALIRAGSAFLVFKGARAALDPLAVSFHRLKDGAQSFTTYLGKASRAADYAEFTGLANSLDSLQDKLREVAEAKEAALRAGREASRQGGAVDFDSVAVLRDQEKEMKASLERTEARLAQLGNRGFTVGARLAGGLGRAFKSLYAAIGGLPGVISLVVTALVFLGDKFGWFTRKLSASESMVKRYREQIQGLTADLQNLDMAAKGSTQFELRLKTEQMEKDYAALIAKLPQKVQEAFRRAGANKQAGAFMDAVATAPQTFYGGASNAAAVGESLGRFGLAPGDVDAGVRATMRSLKDLLGVIGQARQGERQLSRTMAANYHQQLAYYQAQEEHLKGIVSKTPEQVAQLEAARARIEEITKLMDGGDKPAPAAPTPSDKKELEEWNGLTLMQIGHAVALIGEQEKLKEALQEVHAAEERIAEVERERAEYAKRPDKNKEQLAAYDAYLAALKGELKTKQASYDKTKQMATLYASLTERERQFVDELGGVEDFLKKGLSPADLDRFLPAVDKVAAWSKYLQEELGKIEQKLALDPAYTDEQAQTDAAVVAATFREKLAEELQKLDLAAFPPEMRDQIREYVKALVSGISGNRKEDPKKELDDLGEKIQNLARSGRTLLNLATAMGRLSKATRDFAGGLLDALDNVGELAQAYRKLSADKRPTTGREWLGFATDLSNLPSTVGVAAGLATSLHAVVDGMQQRRKDAREQAEAHQKRLRELADSLRSYQQQIKSTIERLFGGGRTGDDLRRSQIEAARDAFMSAGEWFERLGARTDRPGRGGRPSYTDAERTQAHDLLGALDAMNLFDVDLTDWLATLLEQNGGDLRTALSEILYGGGSSRDDWKGIGDVLAKLEHQFSDFTEDLDGAIDAASFFARFMGEDAFRQFDRFLAALLDEGSDLFKKLDDDLIGILKEAKGLDLKDPSGRRRLLEIIQTVAAGFGAYQGDLTSEELERLLQELQRMYDESEQQPAGDEEWSKSVQYLRQITTAQGEEMVLLLREIAYFSRMMAEKSGAVRVPTVVVPTAHTLSAAAPAARIYQTYVGDVNVTGEADISRITAEFEKAIRAKSRAGFHSR